MTTISHVMWFLEELAPAMLAADWDNVGMLLGDRSREVKKVITCLTVTPPVVDEAIAEQVDLIVTHHPIPFRAVKTITSDSYTGGLLWRLASAGVSVYSSHTAFDNAADGINARLAAGLGLQNVEPLDPFAADYGRPGVGVGRRGHIQPTKLRDFVVRAKTFLKINHLDVVGRDDRSVAHVAVACGSAGELMDIALGAGCDCFVTGEARFHTAVEAEAHGIAMVLLGHYASERFGVEHLADVLRGKFPQLTVWPSRRESDPLRRV
jgi:dinuclear metal center YbgI/SA1388 family protein